MRQNLIEKVLREHIEERNAFFVFPTQTAADLWADRATFVTSVTAVATERFVAWDSFKSESIRGIHQDKKSIPSTMRKIFASYIIRANAENPFFSYIITKEYSSSARRFTDWIAKLLPQLAIWKRFFDDSRQAPDEEDKDLLQLYERYSAFLNEFGFFDPAWETPPFKADGRKYFIFFPEILSDYIEYEAVLRSSPDITIVSLPPVDTANCADAGEVFAAPVENAADAGEVAASEESSGNATESVAADTNNAAAAPVLFFNNSRTEIKHVAAFVAELHEKKNIPWTDIAVSVPDMESYGAYLCRELSLLEIPYMVRNAAALSATGAGGLFSQIMQCASDGCSYGSLYSLMLNSELPWKDSDKNRQLLEFGRKNHCICNFEYKGDNIDVWEKSFDDISDGSDNVWMKTALRGYYRSLRGSIKNIAESVSFEKLRDNYFAFRESFFNMAECSAQSDLILSRCIKELGSLIDLEKEFFSVESSIYKPESPFSFFTDYISGIQYLEQTDKIGVQVLPYKLASCAPFACHIVVDASQSSVSVVYNELSFLQEDKRKYLTKRDEVNCTEEFLRLYRMNSTEVEAHFTAAEKTFTGYAQTSSCLSEKDMRKVMDEAELFGENPYGAEKRWFLSSGDDTFPDDALFPERIPESVKSGFESWLSAQEPAGVSDASLEVTYADFAPSGIFVKSSETEPKTVAVSKTRLSDFFFCPRGWFLKYVLRLKELDNAATLMNRFAYGNLYHKICELFMLSLKAASLPLHAENGQLTEEYYRMLLLAIDEAIISKKQFSDEYENCYLSRELLNTTKGAIVDQMTTSLASLSTVFEGCVVDEVESEYTVCLPEKSYACTGRIDCLLRDPSNDRYFLVDYKANNVPKKLYLPQSDEGSSEKPADGTPSVTPEDDIPLMQQELPDFQMPMYVYLLEHAEKKRIVHNACFFSISDAQLVNVFGEDVFSRNPPSPQSKIKLQSKEDFDPVVAKLEECMDYYADCISSGKFRTDPEVQEFVRCSECTYKGLCRKTFNVGKKD